MRWCGKTDKQKKKNPPTQTPWLWSSIFFFLHGKAFPILLTYVGVLFYLPEKWTWTEEKEKMETGVVYFTW